MRKGRVAAEKSNTGPNIEVDKLPVFSGKVSRVVEFILEDEDERSSSGGENSVGTVICIVKVSGYVEREYIRRSEIRRDRI